MGIEASQIPVPVMFFFCLLLLCALVISKISGIQAKKERKASLSRIGITAGVLVAGSTLAAGTAMAVEPVGNFFIGVYGHLRGILAAVVYGFGRIIQFFFTGSKVRLDEQAESSSSSGMETGDSTAGGVEFNLDIFRLFFHIIMIGLAVVLFIGLLRLLLRLTVGSRIRRVAGTKGSGEEQLPLWLSLIHISVFVGVGGGTTNGVRSAIMAKDAEADGAWGVVVNAPMTNDNIRIIRQTIDIPIIATVLNENVDINGRLEAGVSIFNVSAAAKTPEVVKSIRSEHPKIPIIATGGPTPETILKTIEAGADCISYTPPSTAEIFADVMERYRREEDVHEAVEGHLTILDVLGKL